MHRFTLSLLALLGALTPHGNGRADPRARSAPARAESVSAKPENVQAKEESDPPATRDGKVAAIVSNDSISKKPANAETAGKRSADPTPSKKTSQPDGKKATGPDGKGAAGAKGSPAWTRVQPGVVKLVRGSESLEVRVLDRKQHLVSTTLPQFARFLRSKSGADHPIDARLVTLLATVSDHFGGREVNVVSGFRPYAPGQYSRHSNHNEGRALDFSIKGVANETVRDFCRTLRNVGVGYYPNSLFVHLDAREGNAYWVDYAAPGQAPRYRATDGTVDDDEEDAIVSVDRGPRQIRNPSDTPRADVTRGRTNGRGGDREAIGERGVFISQ
jgi:uncharacterized protein YcbK (DUF882 family)